MKVFNTKRRKVGVGAVGVIAALGIGGTAYAATTTSPTPASPAASTTAAPITSSTAKTDAHRTLWKRADHATAELKVKGQWVSYTLDRGNVTAVSPTSITLDRPDGQSVTERISSTTRFAGVSSESAVTVGKQARVLSQNGAAIRISARAAKASPTTSSTTVAAG